mgnify:CR=1 FL=1
MDPAPAASAVAPCAREVVGAPRTLLDLLTPPWFLGLPTVERVRLLDARDPVALDHFGYTWLCDTMYCRCGMLCHLEPQVGPARCSRCRHVLIEIVAVL